MSRYCEDYPSCGHTPNDPCDYSGPSSYDMLANPARYHIGCDHETGYCEYEDDYEESDEREKAARQIARSMDDDYSEWDI